jgi:hypothetical protein
MISVRAGNMEMCKLLLDNGASPSIHTPDNVHKYMIILYHMLIYTCMFVYMYICMLLGWFVVLVVNHI